MMNSLLISLSNLTQENRPPVSPELVAMSQLKDPWCSNSHKGPHRYRWERSMYGIASTRMSFIYRTTRWPVLKP